MKQIVLFALFLFLSGSPLVSAQHPSAMFDRFGDTCCDDEKARLDNFVLQLRNEPTFIGYIVYYGGRHVQSCGSKRALLPRPGEAQARAARLKPYIASRWPNFDDKRLIVINGGYRESWEVELWLIPAALQPPVVTPTVKSSAIKFRRGRARARDYRCEV
jgi:hypothetical protein